jgi:two-component system CheB/CheR fusion protein
MSLRLMQHDVQTAQSGRVALEIVREFKPEVAVIDIGMPDLDGYELARQLRQAEPGVRFVALSGYGHDEALRRARDAGFDEYVVKPATPEELNERIGRVCGAARTRK